MTWVQPGEILPLFHAVGGAVRLTHSDSAIGPRACWYLAWVDARRLIIDYLRTTTTNNRRPTSTSGEQSPKYIVSTNIQN